MCSPDQKFCSTSLRHGLMEQFGQDEVMWYGCTHASMCSNGETGYNFLDRNGKVDIEFCCDGDGCNELSLMEPPTTTTTTTTENPSLKLGEMLLSILDARYVKRSAK